MSKNPYLGDDADDLPFGLAGLVAEELAALVICLFERINRPGGEDVEGFVTGRRSLPDGAVLVTIDDGVRSVYTHALPVLSHYGIPAVNSAARIHHHHIAGLGAGNVRVLAQVCVMIPRRIHDTYAPQSKAH
jgi:hypothetical protein